MHFTNVKVLVIQVFEGNSISDELSVVIHIHYHCKISISESDLYSNKDMMYDVTTVN